MDEKTHLLADNCHDEWIQNFFTDDTYPTFPSGIQIARPLDSLHPHCILGSLRSIQSNGKIQDMSLKKGFD